MTNLDKTFFYMLLGTLSFFAKSDINVLQSIDFGTIAVTKNSFPGSIYVDPAGNVQVTGGLALLTEVQVGVFEITNYPENTQIDVEVNVVNSQMIPQIASEETFQFEVFINSNSLLTDSSGTTLLRVGAKITTSGSGSIAFTDTAFDSAIQITVNL